MFAKIGRRGITLWFTGALALLLGTAQAQAQVALNGRPLRPTALQQSIALQQNLALQQYAAQQYLWQQYAWQYQQQNVVLYTVQQAQQQNTLLNSVQQLQQQNALLTALLQQQAILQQIQQPGGAAPGQPLLPLLPR
jgi:hypothetical protein